MKSPHVDDTIDRSPTVGVVGLGYVGLPLAVRLAKTSPVVGYDLSSTRVRALSGGTDATGELTTDWIQEVRSSLVFSDNPSNLDGLDFYIVAVPTPITPNNTPDLRSLAGASETVGRAMRKDAIVVYESTVYPGCTEEFCVPILERESGLKFNEDFFVGYSPERINPGDKIHTVDKIVKVTSGSTPQVAAKIDRLYASVIEAGTYRATSIRVAEAAKVIENTQRDLNIAFVNELAVMFSRMGLDTTEVLEAARTKWNFLPFKPGLVGGHCIGVDPYYLTHKAQEIGHHPEIILAGRRLNDAMGSWVASQVIKLLIRKRHSVADARVLVMGITFKENTRDIRNTRVVDVISELQDYGCQVDVWDPWADSDDVENEYGWRSMTEAPGRTDYAAVVLAVAHREFLEINPRSLICDSGVVYDVKSAWPRDQVDARL